MSAQRLRQVAIAYCVLPVLLFLCLWTRPLVGLAASACLVLAFWRAETASETIACAPFERCARDLLGWGSGEGASGQGGEGQEGASSQGGAGALLPRRALLLIAGIALVWCVLGGQGDALELGAEGLGAGMNGQVGAIDAVQLTGIRVHMHQWLGRQGYVEQRVGLAWDF